MEIINIEGSLDTPKVILDATNDRYEISGRSLPEDAVAFYNPIIEWLEKYGENPKRQMNLVVKLEYFNTASSKLILDLLTVLEDIHTDHSQVLVKWYYLEDDEDMLEAGEEYEDLIDLPFELIPYED